MYRHLLVVTRHRKAGFLIPPFASAGCKKTKSQLSMTPYNDEPPPPVPEQITTNRRLRRQAGSPTVRNYMLESTDIGESLERLLGDFDNLNAPHDASHLLP